ncbi:hypothetical protein N752_26250 [Desulforamulus aquiferis]|nr:hypothetical protein N752_26250 [Desulforamulus aquiferis]
MGTLLLSFSAEMSRLPQMLMQNVSVSVQLATFLIAWLPITYFLWHPKRFPPANN